MATNQKDLFEKMDVPNNVVDPKDDMPELPELEPAGNQIEIEVVNDTPEEDQKPKAAEDVEKFDPDDDEDHKKEIDDYGENAQKRIKQLSFQYHEERRQRENAHRQNEEAIRFAQQITQENQALKQALDIQNETLSKELDDKNAELLEKARSDYRTAYENGDSEGLVSAQERMSALYVEKMVRPAAPKADAHPNATGATQATVPVPQMQQPLDISPPDEKAVSWLRENPWFQAPGNEAMTGLALGLHEQLVKGGMNPATDDEYYDRINSTLHAAFPDFFGQDKGREGNKPAATARKPAPVAAPTRGGKAPRKVQLTATQVALAKRLGLTTEQYAEQVAKEMANNG